MDQFRASVNLVSTYLNRYFGFALENIVYDKNARTYMRGTFQPQFLEPNASSYLVRLRSLADNTLEREDSWITKHPPSASESTQVSSIDPMTFRSVVGAIRRSEEIEVGYQSHSKSNQRWRWIASPALAFESFRWHARAFCPTNECFTDFPHTRMLDIRAMRQSDATTNDDSDWNSEVMLEISPHPDLSKTQAKVIALDYGIRRGRTRTKVHRASLYFALRRLGLDTDPVARSSQDQQIVLINVSEIGYSVPSVLVQRSAA